jgi:hypothetical protein
MGARCERVEGVVGFELAGADGLGGGVDEALQAGQQPVGRQVGAKRALVTAAVKQGAVDGAAGVVRLADGVRGQLGGRGRSRRCGRSCCQLAAISRSRARGVGPVSGPADASALVTRWIARSRSASSRCLRSPKCA